MPRDDPVDVSDEEMDEFDRELENFKRFCFMTMQSAREPTQGCCKDEPKGSHSELTLGPSHNFYYI